MRRRETFSRPRCCSRELEADGKRCLIAIGRCCRSQHELIAATPEDPIMLVSRGTHSSRGIGRVSMDAIRQSVVEIHLRRELKGSWGRWGGPYLEMDMHRPAFIPTGVYGDESDLAALVGDLVAAEKLPADCIEPRITHVGVEAHRIAVPNIDLSPREGLTASGIDARDDKRESQWSTGPDQSINGIRTDVGPMQALVDEVRPFGLLGSNDARQSAGIGKRSPEVRPAREPQQARDAQ